MIWMKQFRWLWLQWSVVDYGFKPGRVLRVTLLPREATGSEPYHAAFEVQLVLAKLPKLTARTAF